MTQFQVFCRIILPQAVRIAIPELGNILINIVKNTSLAYLIGVFFCGNGCHTDRIGGKNMIFLWWPMRSTAS